MTEYIHAFNSEGIEAFRNYIELLRSNPELEFPRDILYDENYSYKLSRDIIIENRNFASKHDAVQYLVPLLDGIEKPFGNIGLWSWLSGFYFDQVCPINSGKRKPNEDGRYILSQEWNNFYRHLLAGPVRMYSIHNGNCMIFLFNPLHEMGEFVEQLMSRQNIALNKELIKLANLMYWNNDKDLPVEGVRLKEHRPGTLRRFVDVFWQFDLTYDLYSMSYKEIASIYPEEFRKYLKNKSID